MRADAVDKTLVESRAKFAEWLKDCRPAPFGTLRGRKAYSELALKIAFDSGMAIGAHKYYELVEDLRADMLTTVPRGETTEYIESILKKYGEV